MKYGHTPLPIATAPLSWESLPGFIARACARNGYYSIAPAMALAGYKEKIGNLGRSSIANWEHIAYVFGCFEEDLEARRHPPCRIEGTFRPFEYFYGSPVRLHMRELLARRSAPASLRSSPYHRAAWLLKAFKYCPESGERLISTCPNCETLLSWSKTVGVEFCEHCLHEEANPSTDLRLASTDRLSGQDLHLYNQVVSLILPTVVPNTFSPAALGSWPPWEIFDLIITLAMILERHSGRPVFASTSWNRSLMVAAQTVVDWPEGIEEVVRLMMKWDQCIALGRAIGPLAFPHYFSGTQRIAVEIDAAVRSCLLKRFRPAFSPLP